MLHVEPLSENDRTKRDLDILALNDLEIPWAEIAWIVGVPVQIIETLVLESLEGEFDAS